MVKNQLKRKKEDEKLQNCSKQVEKYQEEISHLKDSISNKSVELERRKA